MIIDKFIFRLQLISLKLKIEQRFQPELWGEHLL